ncbi:MAG: cytochrome C [Acidobacteria bacterium]|nr:MAG: cytochrome C [Acidobacteriota bacterium]
MATGLSARAQPGLIETRLARAVRGLAIPRDVKRMANPVPKSADVVAAGMSHFADHCASCHANDGSGKTEMGQGLFPKAPDMRQPATQQLTDGELFYIIENGVRFTGMPAWSTGAPDGEQASWHLVHFIRALPTLTPEQIAQMEGLNPKPPEEIRQQIEEERFLKVGGDTPPTPKPHAH